MRVFEGLFAMCNDDVSPKRRKSSLLWLGNVEASTLPNVKCHALCTLLCEYSEEEAPDAEVLFWWNGKGAVQRR